MMLGRLILAGLCGLAGAMFSLLAGGNIWVCLVIYSLLGSGLFMMMALQPLGSDD